MIKHKMISPIVILAAAMTGLGACKKEVTQRVDQAYSVTYTIKPSDWSTSDGGKSYTVNLPVKEVDPVIVESGGIMVYLSFDNGGSFEALPEVYGNVAYGTYHSNQTVSIDLSPPAGIGTGTITPPSTTLLAKLVIVDATPL